MAHTLEVPAMSIKLSPSGEAKIPRTVKKFPTLYGTRKYILCSQQPATFLTNLRVLVSVFTGTNTVLEKKYIPLEQKCA